MKIISIFIPFFYILYNHNFFFGFLYNHNYNNTISYIKSVQNTVFIHVPN